MTSMASDLVSAEQILYLSRRDAEACLAGRWHEAMDAIGEAYALLSAGEAVLTKAEYLKYKSRPSYDRIIPLLGHLGGRFGVSGLKEICSSTTNSDHGFPRASGLLILNDPLTQRPYCIMEASIVSAMRTAAVTGLALQSLSRGGYRSVAVLGCGALARAHLEMFTAVLASPKPALHVHDPNPQKLASFCEAATQAGFQARVARSVEDAVRGVDCIIPATTSETPYIKAGMLGHCWTYFAVSLLDADVDVYEAADLIVVDDLTQSLAEGRPLERLARAGAMPVEKIVDIGTWLSAGRARTEDRVLFNPMGTVITDLALAVTAFETARQRGLGQRLPI